MARTIKETFRQFLPGAGRNTLGSPVQGKTRLTGRISVTSYTVNGETLTPTNLGLEVIDWINIRVQDEVGGPAVSGRRYASYNQTNDQFYLYTVGEAGQVAEYNTAATETLEYEAEGDSALNVELV